MRKDDEFMMGRFLRIVGEAGQTSEKSFESAAAEQALSSVRDRAQSGNNYHRGRRPMVAFLIGALMLMLGVIAAPTPSSAHVSVGIFVNFGPPALPVYEQPPCPAPGYIWTPGYWAWDPGYGYYWVPGTWVQPPFAGALWTPGYWDYDDGGYRWRAGYWGMSVGWYGGIDYGFGYTGYGYDGGYWRHRRFYYNRAENRIEGRDFHYYYRREERPFARRRVSYHGGPGGIRFGPSREQRAASRERHFGPVRQQFRQRQFARRDPMQQGRRNFGSVRIAAPRRFGNQDRGFRSFRSPRNTRTFYQRANRAPVQRMTRRPVYRNNQRAFQHFQRRSRPQEMRQYRAHVAPFRRGPAPRQQWHGGHGHPGGHGNDRGQGHGRGGRH